jgi:hypothetical protein
MPLHLKLFKLLNEKKYALGKIGHKALFQKCCNAPLFMAGISQMAHVVVDASAALIDNVMP